MPLGTRVGALVTWQETFVHDSDMDHGQLPIANLAESRLQMVFEPLPERCAAYDPIVVHARNSLPGTARLSSPEEMTIIEQMVACAALVDLEQSQEQLPDERGHRSTRTWP